MEVKGMEGLNKQTWRRIYCKCLRPKHLDRCVPLTHTKKNANITRKCKIKNVLLKEDNEEIHFCFSEIS